MSELALQDPGRSDRWLRRFLTRQQVGLHLLLMMEVSWLVPIFRATVSPNGGWSTPAVLGLLWAIALGSMYLTRLMERTGLPALARDGLQLLALMAMLGASLNWIILSDVGMSMGRMFSRWLQLVSVVLQHLALFLVVLLSVIYAWWRGSSGARISALAPAGVGFRFRLIVLLLAFEAGFARGQGVGRILEVLPITFGAGLLAMSISRAESIARSPGARKNPFGRGWAIGAALMVVTMVAGGIGLGYMLRSTMAFELARWFGAALISLLQVLLAPVLYVFFLAIYHLLRNVGLSQEQPLIRPEAIQGVQSWMREMQSQAGEQADWLVWINAHGDEIKFALLAGVLLLILAGVILAARSGGSRQQAQAADRGESLYSPEALLENLRSRLRVVGEALDPRRHIAGLRRRWVESVVRRIYTQFLNLAEKRGMARWDFETPLEFLGRLQASYPESEAPALVITQAYNEVRYGEFPDEAIDLTAVRSSWRDLRTRVMQGEPEGGQGMEAGAAASAEESK
jgi:hypothetical protein